MGERVLIVVAHPDDETFGCGSLIAYAVARGAEVTVCCATRGDAGGDGAVREGELRAAGQLLGVSRIVVLGFGDSDMAGEPAPGTLCAADPADVCAAVARVVDETDPDVVVTLDASDGHRDHARIRDATVAVVRPPRRLYLHALPRSLVQRWVDLTRVGQPDSAHLELETTTLGTPDEDVTTVLDTSAHLALRWDAIRLHASQRSPFEVMPRELQEAFLTEERLIRLLPPWSGGPVERDLFAEVSPRA